MIDTSQDPRFIDFATRVTGTKEFGECKTIAVIGEKILAVIVYNTFDESNCGLSIATSTPKWCSRRIIRVCLGYPFLQLGLNRITCLIRESNAASLSLCSRLGFTPEGELRGYYANGESAMIFGLTRQECIWL